jgi:hypothetical protein
MTLIVGVHCRDGIVIGSDGATTCGALGQNTVRQPVRKLEIINNKIVLGVSGPVGLGQRFRHEIENADNQGNFQDESIVSLGVKIRNLLWQHIAPELQIAARAGQFLGNQITMSSALSATLAAATGVFSLLLMWRFEYHKDREAKGYRDMLDRFMGTPTKGEKE